METKEKRYFFSKIPSWGLSLITAFVSLILLFVLASLLSAIPKIGENLSEVIAYISYDIIIAIACFFICRHNPKSIAVVLPGRAVRYLPAPPQTRTSGFPAYGSSKIGFAVKNV